MPKIGMSVVEQFGDRLDGVIAGLRIAGTVGQEHAVGIERQHIAALVVAGTTVMRQP